MTFDTSAAETDPTSAGSTVDATGQSQAASLLATLITRLASGADTASVG